MNKQQLCNSFYDIGNLVTVSIAMPDADWQALKKAEPRGGRCNFSYVGDRYDWYKTTSVTVSGSKFPKAGTFSGVGIIKKSYCGSFSTTKPSLRLEFARYVASNETAAEALIGTQHVTLNNSIQDPSYIRQTLGYDLFRQAGLPYARCNFAKVIVNGTDMGVYVNLEPMKKLFVQHNFAGNDKGNAYELEVGEDLDSATLNAGRISFEGFSSHKDLKDLKLASTQIAGGLSSAKQVVDFGEFIKFFAMETLLKHWDGYANNKNNTYIYNDTSAVADPTVANVKLKFIVSGIDQILQENQDFHVGGQSVLAALVRADKGATSDLFTAIRNYATTIFDRDNHDKATKPLIDKMEALLKAAGVTSATAAIDVVRRQIKLVKSGAFQLIGEFPKNESLYLDKSTGDCFHASNTEFVTGPPDYHQEVYHDQPTGASADFWRIDATRPNITFRFMNSQYGTWLHCDKTIKTPGGHLNVYAFRGPNLDQVNVHDFYIEPIDAKQWHASGYFKIKNAQTMQYVYFSETDKTPKGKKEVHQVGTTGEATSLFLF